MSRSPTSAELSSTSCYPNTHSVWFTKAVVPFESVLQHPENSQVAGFWILFNGLLQNASKSHIFPNRSPFPSGFRHSKSSGKIVAPLVHQWLHLSTGWDGKPSGQVSRVVPVQDQGLAVEKKNDELLPRGSN